MRHFSIRSALVGVSCFAVLFVFSGVAMGKAPTGRLNSSLPTEQAEILQFQTGGHVLGFSSDKVYMVGLGYALIEEFVGASKVTPVSGTQTGSPEGGEDSTKGAPAFQGVTYPNLWKGVTLRYDRASDGLAESVYVIRPGADVGNIRIRYNVDFSIEDDGALRFSHPTKKGYFTLSRPVAWQEIEGSRVPVEVAFRDYGNRTLGFVVGARDPGLDLIIDPTYQWHTFYGSANSDIGYGIAVTGDGVYVTGYSYATWQGDGDQNPIHDYSDSPDMVILKLNLAGAYHWHTFYGSASADYGYGIAVTGEGVYVTGWSIATWQGDGDHNPIHAHSGACDMVILKLGLLGTYQWHTFYGTGESEEECDVGYSIAVAGDGVYVTGYSSKTWQGDGGQNPIHPYSGNREIVILKLSLAGAYQWHTFYGSASADYGYGIAVTGDGVYVTGESNATWQGDGGQNPIHPYSDSREIVILKLGLLGAYQYHTFYGTGESDQGRGIAVTGNGVYVSGYSSVTWQGDGGTDPVHGHSGDSDIAILKLSDLPYYMAKSDGNWSDAGIWYSNTTGGTNPDDYATPAGAAPTTDNSARIIVNANVTVTADVTIDQTTVNTGKSLTVADGVTLTVADGDGTDLDVNGTLTLAGGASVNCQGGFDATGGAVTFTGDGALYLSGDVVGLGTLTPGEGTVGFAGTTAQTITGSNTLYNLVIDKDNPSDTVDATGSTLVVTNGLSITQGVFTSASSFKDVVISLLGTLNLSGDITVSGDWMNLFGTFIHNNHTVTLNGADQYLFGSTTFYNLTKEIAAAATLEFYSDSDSTTTVANALTLRGAAGQLLSLRSDDPGAQWKIDPQGTRTIAYVAVQDSNNVSATAINAQGTNSVDSGNNSNWLFDPSLTYDGNGATSGTAPVDPNSPYAPGAEVTVLGNSGGLVKTNHTFVNWNTQIGGGGTAYNPGATFDMPTTDVTLYAQWTLNTYAVTYNGNGATSGTPPADQIKTHGVDLTLATNSGNLAKTGYTFAGWNTATDGSGTDYAAGGTYTANEAVILYAKWTPIPTDPVILVTPVSLHFGYVPVGSAKHLTLTVKNTGGGTVTGTATTVAPFSIFSGGSYNLGAGKEQSVTIRYQPTSPGKHTDVVRFTGASGATVPVTGRTEKSLGLPWLLLLLD